MESGAAAALASWLRTGRTPEPRSEVEANALVDAADRQRLAPLLYAAASRGGSWPDAGLERLRRLHHVAFARGVRQLALAGDVLGALETAGVRALPLKGAALAERAYDSPAERPMGDVDVLVLDAWPPAVDAVRALGLEPVASGDHAVAFAVPGGATLELHHSVASCPGLHPRDSEGLWSRSAPAEGQVRRQPSAEDLLVQLAVHAAFQHGLVLTLVQYLDFKRLVSREGVRPDRLREVAAGARAEAALGASLAVADALVGVELGPREQPLPPGLERWLSPRLAEPLRWFLTPHPVPLARARWELCPGRRGRLLLETLSPTPPVPEPLPKRLATALVRAVRLLRRWFLPGH